MKDVIIFAIETSCDETSLALVKNGTEVLKQVTNTQIDKFKDLGGVVPEVSSRLHEKNIFYVYQELFKQTNISWDDIDAIAITQGPGLIGSLLVGVNFAKALAHIHNKKLIGINHMQAHIYAVCLQQKMKFPHLSLIISGGHTELVYLEKENHFLKIGYTLDDAVGECYDKVARLLGMKYPGGPEIDRLAQTGEDTYKLPIPKNDETLNFSFSGLKSACYNTVNTLKMRGEQISKNNFARSFQNVILDNLDSKFELAYNKYKPIQTSIVGGVSANIDIRKHFSQKYDNIIIPELKYTTDNAAMIGALAYIKYKENNFENILNFDANVNLEIEMGE